MSKWQYYALHPDATGNVGQFVMGNEPSFHIPYLYNYAGQPWKTQKRIRMLMESWFRNDLMGVCGDEDGGGMSAFYDSAVDIAKESADIILLEKDLMVLEDGVLEGRKTFGNITKYIKMTASSNFGNMFSVMAASAFLKN